jgi:serine phosphatase RsbU (regulator of sigma subunit)
MIELESDLQKKVDELTRTKTEFLDSLHYASTVQLGVLSHERHFKRNFKDFFIIYQPHNIIGGDLYWTTRKGKYVFLAVGDCTGHGVSGAILTVLAISYLNYILLNKEIKHAGEILDHLDEKWIETFQQGAKKLHNNDWLEISICVYNTETSEIEFAGANSKALIIKQNGEFLECIGNKYPIGGWQLEKNRKYNTKNIEVLSGDMIYLFSDGFKDQFGGNSGKRLTKKNFYNLLSNSFNLPCEIQKKYLSQQLNNWIGGEEKTDDICVVGVRI